MCDCFHRVLPTWPGAPGSVSGRQLQPEEPDADTEEDQSVTEGPVDEIIRPRPQGSSPVYEHAAEGVGSGLPEDTPRRRASSDSGGRRSWWKRESGDSRTFSRMSHPQEATEVMLTTEAEAGASGYSVTGGGDQGIFVKQVLKDSSAAKLFSLREGDQLLSATIFFDNIKYEDALKILQYSEPYKVQFQVKRKRPATEDEEGATRGAQHGPKGSEKQDKDVADGSTETPTQTLEGGGDQERLLAKPREGRCRRPPKERLSWPKFQSITSKPGPRRSHSSSGAYGRGDAPDVSPTSADTEAQLPAEDQEQKAEPDGQRKRRFLNLRFRMGSGKGPTLEGRPSRGVQGGALQAGVVEEAGSWEDRREATEATVQSRGEDRTAEVPAGTPREPGAPSRGALGEGASMASRRRKQTKDAKDPEDAVSEGKPGLSSAPQGGEDLREVAQGMEAGIARSALQGKGDAQGRQPEFQIQIPSLKTPMFKLSKERNQDTEGGTALLAQGDGQGGTAAEETPPVGEGAPGPQLAAPRKPKVHLPEREEGGAGGPEEGHREREKKDGDKDKGGREERRTMLRFNIPSFGWSPRKDVRAAGEKPVLDLDQEIGSTMKVKVLHTEDKEILGEGKEETRDPRGGQPTAAEEQRLEGDLSLGDKEVAARDSKFKMPKFKMPSFGTSVPSKDLGTSVDVSVPKVGAETTLPSLGGEVRAPEGATQVPTADIDLPGGELEVSLPEGEVAVSGLKGKAEGVKIKGQLPKVSMPSLKMPTVDIKAPQVDIEGPKLDLKGAKGEVSAPDMEVSLPSMEVDAQVPDAKVEADLSLGDKEMAARDTKFKMPKFKMPSFGMSAPSKSLEASVDAALPKVQAEVSMPSIQADVKTSDVTIELPSADLDVKTASVGLKLPEGQVPEGKLQEPSDRGGLKGHLPKVQMPNVKMPKVDFKAPQVDIKGPKLDLKGAKGEVSAPDVEVSLPKVEVAAQVLGAKVDADLSLGDKEVAARDSKFKMPKFKMPSFGASAPSKDLGTSVDVSVPKVGAEATLPSLGGEVRAPEGALQMPTADIDFPGGELEVSLPEGEVAVSGLKSKAEGVKIKGQLPKVPMPSLKMPTVDIKAPQVDIKAPQVDIKGPKLDLKGPKGEASAPNMEVSLPSVEVDAQVPGAKLEADLSLGDKEVAARDTKFKMPKFKMPSFGVSAPSKNLGTSVDVDVSVPKVRAEATLSSLEGEVRAPEGALQVPTADIDLPGGELEVSLPEGEVAVSGLKGKAEGVKIKGQLPKVPMPSLKMPKVDIKAPQVDIKVPQVDIKGPKLDLKGTKGEVSTPDMEVSLPSMEVDAQVPDAKMEPDPSLGNKEVAARDSKFKMPKFKMPSFGASAPSKSLEASVDASLPKVQAEVSMPSIQADVKTSDVTTELPSADLNVKTASVGLKLPEGQVPEGRLQEPSAAGGLKGHLPKVQMPSIKMPKVDFKAPQVDIKGPNLDLKGAKGEVSAPDMVVSLPSVEVDAQVSDAKVEAELSLGDKEVTSTDSKFKMPKFKMPSFGTSVPSKDLGTSMDVSVPKVGAEATQPSLRREVRSPEGAIQLPTADIDLPGGELEVSLPEGEVAVSGLKGKAEGVKIKGQLPKVQMLSLKMPKVDIKAPQVDIKVPQVDIKGPKLDLKGAKGEVSTPNVEVSLPALEVDTQVPRAKVEADLSLGDKEVAARDSKFKMPKFKMPSFGTSVPSKDLGTSVDVSVPKVGAEATLSSLGGELRAPEGAAQVPTADIDLPGGELEVSLPEGEVAVSGLKGKAEGVKIKGQLPKVQMPSLKMPKVDIKAPQVDIKVPQVDIKGPKLDLKGAKGEASAPDVEVSLPSVEVDTQVPDAKVEADLSLGDKEVAARDSKFKMPKFKMPSFGASVPSKSLEASVDAALPKVQAEVSIPSIQADVKTSEVTIKLPSADLDVKTASVGLRLPEGPVPEGELQEPSDRGGLKGHLPRLLMPSIKMPKVDFKAPQVDIKGPNLDLKGAKGEVSAPDVMVSLPAIEVDAQVPGDKLEADLSLVDKEVASRDSKFKMPKFKMPSFSASAPSKDLGTSVDVSVPKVGAEATLPSLGGEVRAPEGAVQMPTADIDLPGGELEVSLPEGEVAVSDLKGKAEGVKTKGQLPKVQMPSLKMPTVDIKAPQVDIKGPKLDLKGTKGEVSAPDVEVSLPSVEVDAQVPGAKVEADLSLRDKEVAARDSKFKMPKFKMPSFGTSAPSKSLEAYVVPSLPKVQVEVSMPSNQADVKTSEVTIKLPSADLDVKTALVALKLPEGQVPKGELQEPSAAGGLKGHLPKVQMPNVKMPKVDIKASQMDIKGPKLDLMGARGEVSAPDMEVSLPAMEVDAQVPKAKVEANLSVGDKEVASRDSKFKMPSFSALALSKDLGTSVDMEVSLPKVRAEATLPSLGGEVRAPVGALQVPTADIDLPGRELEVSLPKGEVAVSGLKGKAEGVKTKGQLPKVQMPSLKMPTVDIKVPQVDIKGPKLDLKGAKGEVSAPDMEVSLPSVEVDAQVPGAKLEADLSLGDKEVATRDSKFKMPKFKMPSFSTSVPSKYLGTSVDVSVPKVGAEATLPSLGGEVRAPEGAVQLPTADIDLPGGELEVSLPEGEVAVSGLKGKAEGVKIKGQLPKVQMPSLKMPTVDIKAPQVDIRAPQVDIKGPKLDLKGAKGEVSAPDVEVSLPSVEVDPQVPGAKSEAELSLGDKEVAARDTKFKMPKFKMPSFGALAPSKDLGTSVDVSLPEVRAEATLPSLGGEMQAPESAVQLPTADIDLPGDKEVAARDSKFKMLTFKMPSFGTLGSSKSLEASVDASLPEVQAEISMPSIQTDVKTSDMTIELPSADLEVKTASGSLKLPEGQVPEGRLQEPSATSGLKGHLPKVQMPSIKMPKVDFKAPQVDIKGPKLDLKDAKGEVSTPNVEVSLPALEVDTQVPRAKVEADLSLGDKEVAARDSKFKMPKFKMPSFGTSVPSKDLGTSVDVSVPKVGAEATLPSLGGEVRAPEGAVQLPTADIDLPGGELEVSLPEGEVAVSGLKGKAEGVKIKGQLPKVPMPSLKMLTVDIKAPQVDIKGPKLDLKDAKGEASAPDVEVSLPSVEVDAQVPGAKLEADLSLGDKEVAARDTKFKMPKFKMPSFGVSAPSKNLGTSVDVDVSVPKVRAEATLHPLGGEVRAPEGALQVPTADIDLPGGELEVSLPEGEVAVSGLKGKAEGVKIKGQLPKVQMPSFKMPTVDIKAPQVNIKDSQVDIKGSKLDLKGTKGEVSAPDGEVSLPSVEVDAQVPDAKMEPDPSLGYKEVATGDSKFKMPKFKMPSFGASAPSKSLEASMNAALPEVQAEVSMPSIQADVKTSDVTIELPSADLDVKTALVNLKLPEGQVPEGELQEPSATSELKGHLPKVQMPGIKMPKVDFRAPQVDIKGPKLDLKDAKGEVSSQDMVVSLPSMEVDTQVPSAKVEAELSLGDKEVAAGDSKFKMPKFKMPTFSTSAPSKSLEASVDASLPKVQAEVSMPSIQADVKTSDVTIELPSADLDVKTASVGLKLPEGQVPEGKLQEPSDRGGLKGHLPKVQMPNVKMPKVDFKAPQVDIKGPKLDPKGAKGEVSAPDMVVSLPSVEVDAQVTGAKLDSSSGEVEVFSKATKFKFPKISISSSRTSPSKTSLISPELDRHDKDTHSSLSSGLRDPIVSGGDQHALHLEGDVALSVGKDGEKSKSKKSHFKLPKVFSPPGKAAKGFVASAEEPEVPLPVRASASPLESGHGGPQGTPAASVETSLQVSRLGWLGGPHGESSCLSTSEGVTLTKYQVTVPRGPVPSELPCETPSGSQAHSQLPSTAGAGDLLSSESILLSQPDGHTGPADTVFPESYGRVTFPKFHRPKFRLSLPTSATGVVEPGAAERAPPTSPPLAAQGLDSSAEEATAFPVPDGHLPPAGVSASTVAEGQAGTAGTLAAAPEEAPAEGAGLKDKGRPVTAPRLKLPSFSWSPKKGVESKADPGHSPAVAADALGGPPSGPVTPAEAGADASLGKDGEAGAVRTPALARLKVAPPGMEASTRGAGLPRGDPGLALAGPTDTAGGEGGVGGTGAAAGPPEGADVSLHLPEAPVPSLGFVRPDLSPGDATMEQSLSTGRLPLPKHGLSLRDSTQEHGPGDSSASQPCGDVTASSAEDPLQPSPAVGSPGRDAAAAEAPAGSRESWFRMPSLRLPGFGRPAKERAGSAGLGAQRPAPVVAGVPGEGEAAAGVRSPDARVPASEVDVAESLQPPEAGADGAAAGSPASSYADVLRRNLDLHAPAEGLSASEVRVRPGAGSLPLQLHGVLAEPCVPPGEAGEPPLPGPAGQGLGRGAQGAEGPPSQPEGPLRLRASSTDVPSQVSVVNVGQVWEDSVLRVQFPKLKVPRFSFPAPGSEADVFVPSVTELSSCPQSGPDTALLEQSPGGLGTSFPKAPVALGLSSEAAPICKVRVHIQGTEAASRQVSVHSTVTAGYAELSGPEAFPTQVVRESELPASETQTPSYGVSLLKGRVPEPPTWAQVQLVTAECGLGGRLREAQEPVPGADPVSGDLQPDTGEPFEMICPSVDVPGPPACSSDLHSGHGHADSCSDEEPAEILEFPPEEGQEAEEAEAPKGKPEGKSSSGLFRFWLPSIGFSPSASETSADSQADAQRPAPVQTQPEARTPPSQEKGGWFRFPKLGFSSSPTKKSESEEEEVSLAEQSLQEEAGTFYDARESFSPDETGARELAEAVGTRRGSGTMVTSTARTELILLERDGAASQQSAPRPATK
ncbi:protein AHNAK2 isoform X2 [Mirounga angustirostris]|uniref:protein AHNAK2 isoform X2 n=1 Tax=Mirounga angustirostris TaxID=9716 RepID=UPI00313C388F